MRDCNKIMKSKDFNTHWGGREFFTGQIDMYAGGNNASSGAHANESNMKGWRLQACTHHQLYFLYMHLPGLLWFLSGVAHLPCVRQGINPAVERD